MKIIKDNAAYLQKYYLDILVKSSLVTDKGVPISMFDVVNKKIYNRYGNKDFLKFTKPDEIEFLKNSEWIIDYNTYINMSEEEIREEINKTDLEGEKLNQYYASLPEDKKQEEYGLLSIKAVMLRHKIESLVDVLYLVKNNKTVKLNTGNLILRLLKR